MIASPHLALSSDPPLIPRQHIQLPNLDHGRCKLLEEQRLVHGEAGDDRPRPGVGVQALVRREEALAVHDIDVVLVVEGVGGPSIEHGGVVGVLGRAGAAEGFGEGLVHGGILAGVEAVVEDVAVADADGVGTGEGDEVGGVEVVLGEVKQEDAGVGGGSREAGDGGFIAGGAEAVTAA